MKTHSVVVAGLVAGLASWHSKGQCPDITSPIDCASWTRCTGISQPHGDPENCVFRYCFGGWMWSMPGPNKTTLTTWGTVQCEVREGQFVEINGVWQCLPDANGFQLGYTWQSDVVSVWTAPCP
jgi:hypothetical protein